MKSSKSELSYRQSAIEGASPLGLVIALLDRLIADLQRAAAALRQDDIETRCRQFDHALLVLAQLETWLDMERASEPARLIASVLRADTGDDDGGRREESGSSSGRTDRQHCAHAQLLATAGYPFRDAIDGAGFPAAAGYSSDRTPFSLSA